MNNFYCYKDILGEIIKLSTSSVWLVVNKQCNELFFKLSQIDFQPLVKNAVYNGVETYKKLLLYDRIGSPEWDA